MQYTVATGIPNIKYGIIPSHKISVSDGGLILHFHYVAEQRSFKQFNETEDRVLLELVFDKAKDMKAGHFELRVINGNTTYKIKRVSEAEFILTALC